MALYGFPEHKWSAMTKDKPLMTNVNVQKAEAEGELVEVEGLVPSHLNIEFNQIQSVCKNKK